MHNLSGIQIALQMDSADTIEADWSGFIQDCEITLNSVCSVDMTLVGHQ